MKRSDEERLLYGLAAYLGASALLTVLLLVFSLAAMKLSFFLAKAAFGPGAYKARTLFSDSVGFALSSAGTALGHYLMVSLLRPVMGDRLFLSLLCAFAALFSGLLFWRGALATPLGAYGFPGLCVSLSALLGGLAAALAHGRETA